MIVITLTNCPLSLRGDLTKWLQEINTGVYVGQVSARVRDNLWKRICEQSKTGRATMVYSARNEQHLDFRVHNTTWEPIDFDGLKLMLRPNKLHATSRGQYQDGFSKASKRRVASKHSAARRNKPLDAYVVLDVETTGLDAAKNEIVEIGALKILDGQETDSFEALIKPRGSLPDMITRLTGLSDEELQQKGEKLDIVLERFLCFLGSLPIVSHNVSFDCCFLDAACEACGIEELDNDRVDTLEMARKRLRNMPDYHLETLAAYFGIPIEGSHRSLPDCRMTHGVFSKLIELSL